MLDAIFDPLPERSPNSRSADICSSAAQLVDHRAEFGLADSGSRRQHLQ
jgi:hypothetical protein